MLASVSLTVTAPPLPLVSVPVDMPVRPLPKLALAPKATEPAYPPPPPTLWATMPWAATAGPSAAAVPVWMVPACATFTLPPLPLLLPVPPTVTVPSAPGSPPGAVPPPPPMLWAKMPTAPVPAVVMVSALVTATLPPLPLTPSLPPRAMASCGLTTGERLLPPSPPPPPTLWAKMP
jgi:hypothetical protein